MYKIVITALLCSFILACKQNLKHTEEVQTKKEITIEQTDKTISKIYGNYVDEGYTKRSEGFDWVALSIKTNDDKSIFVSVRSRADKKRPTCTFDTKAFKEDDNSYTTIYDGTKIIFDFSENEITISTENHEDINLLNFFCSGGASIAGTYKKINENLDSQQIDLTSYFKVLSFQGIGFNISSIKKNDKNTFSIFTFGLKEHEYNESFNIEGEEIMDAEVGDINSDGSPEIFVYTISIGSGSYGNVYPFSVNNNKSMSQVYFQPTSDNDKINKGYMGHDEFSIIENSLTQRFPLYRDGDTNTKPTGGIRSVSYKLIDGEAMRKLVVDNITEY